MLSASQISLANQVAQSLIDNGAPSDKLGWLIGQISIEGSNFTNPIGLNHNNWGGIKFENQNTPGIYDSGVVSSEGDNYAGYDSIDDFSKDYLRILTTVDKHQPLQQTTPEAFVTALKADGYFGGSLTDYINIVKTNSVYYLKNVLKNIEQDVKDAATATITTITTVKTNVKNNPGSTAIILLLIGLGLYGASKINF